MASSYLSPENDYIEFGRADHILDTATFTDTFSALFYGANWRNEFEAAFSIEQIPMIFNPQCMYSVTTGPLPLQSPAVPSPFAQNSRSIYTRTVRRPYRDRAASDQCSDFARVPLRTLPPVRRYPQPRSPSRVLSRSRAVIVCHKASVLP
jgi:hypothetical protein